MKIRDITIDLYKAPPQTASFRGRRFAAEDDSYAAVLRIHAGDLQGVALISRDARAGSNTSQHEVRAISGHILGRIKPELVGRDVHEREWLFSQLYAYRWWGRMPVYAWAMVDVAMWDLAGKAAGLAAYKLLGACRPSVPAYDNVPHSDRIEPQLEFIRQKMAAGWRAFKLHPGGVPVEQNIELIRQVRRCAGDSAPLISDDACRYRFEDALRIGRELMAMGYLWYEDPLRHTDAEGYRQLCSRLDIPVAYSDHWDVGLDELAAVIRGNSGIRIVRGDVTRLGITGLRRLATLAEACGLRCEVHHGGSPNLAVILSVSNCDYYEHTSWWQGGDVCVDQLRIDEQGNVRPSDSPGVGLAINEDVLAGCLVERLT
jgi:L-alanine-DL-glutamate epimerase-like enolase superfamily enzyme